MMKKIAALAGAGALLLSLAGPAFGCSIFDGWTNCGGGSDDVTIHNKARVCTSVTTKADSGDNDIHGKYVWGGKIKTGLADATTWVKTQVNYNEVACPGCEGDVDIWNKAKVKTRVYTKADSGDNDIHGKCVGGAKIKTGGATAYSDVMSLVNFNLVGVDGLE